MSLTGSAHLLVPAPAPPAAPAEYTLVDVPLLSGLPQSIVLDARFSVIVTVPTGLARGWREADPSAVVTSSADEDAPAEMDDDPHVSSHIVSHARAAARLVLRLSDGRLVGAAALVGAGTMQTIVDPQEDPRALLHVIPLSWDIRAGNLVGPGDVGGHVRFAWRDAAAASVAYGPPAVDPRVAPYLTIPRRSQVVRPRLRWELLLARRLWQSRRARLLRIDTVVRR